MTEKWGQIYLQHRATSLKINLSLFFTTPSRKTKLQAETVQDCHEWETAQSLNGLKPWRILSD